MRRIEALGGLAILKKISNRQNLENLEIRPREGVVDTDRLGKVVILFLRIDQLIGIHHLFVIFPGTDGRGRRRLGRGRSFVELNPLSQLVEVRLVRLELIGPLV
jgi:hypothetical protein